MSDSNGLPFTCWDQRLRISIAGWQLSVSKRNREREREWAENHDD